MKKHVLFFAPIVALPLSVNAAVIYFSDFETDNGGWVASADWDPVGDWEWGDYDLNSYVGAYNPPPAAYSGTKLWATLLHEDHTNAGGFSWLSQTFDLTGWYDVEMSWANWAEVFYAFDTAKLFVNGTLLYERTSSAAPVAWEIETVSLAAFDNMANVTVTFELYATTVVNRAGWYIDDVLITGIPAPSSAGLLGLAGALGMRRRR